MSLNSQYRRLMYLDIMEDRPLVAAEKRLMKLLSKTIGQFMVERGEIERKIAIGQGTKRDYKRHKIISQKLGLS